MGESTAYDRFFGVVPVLEMAPFGSGVFEGPEFAQGSWRRVFVKEIGRVFVGSLCGGF